MTVKGEIKVTLKISCDIYPALYNEMGKLTGQPRMRTLRLIGLAQLGLGAESGNLVSVKQSAETSSVTTLQPVKTDNQADNQADNIGGTSLLDNFSMGDSF